MSEAEWARVLASTQIYMYRCFTSNFVYIGGGKQSQEMRDL